MDNIVKEIKAFRDAGEPAQFLLEHCVRKLHGSLEKWNWVGIYLFVGDTLVLGPFAGEPTEHTRIPHQQRRLWQCRCDGLQHDC